MNTLAASKPLSPSSPRASATSSEAPGARRGAPAAARFVGCVGLAALALGAGCRRDPAPQTANNYYGGGYGTATPNGSYPPASPTDPGWNTTAPAPQTTYPPAAPAPAPAPQGGTAPAAGGFPIPGFPFPMPGGGGTGDTGGGTSNPPAPGLPGGGSLLQPLLTPLANQHAPGARPEGQPVSGFISQGQPSTTPVQIAPGKCYTAIAVASPPIGDLMVELVATPPAPFPPATLSQAAGGTQVVMAGQPNCFRALSPVAINGVLRVTARQGSGPVLAQLYAKLTRRRRDRPPWAGRAGRRSARFGRSAPRRVGRRPVSSFASRRRQGPKRCSFDSRNRTRGPGRAAGPRRRVARARVGAPPSTSSRLARGSTDAKPRGVAELGLGQKRLRSRSPSALVSATKAESCVNSSPSVAPSPSSPCRSLPSLAAKTTGRPTVRPRPARPSAPDRKSTKPPTTRKKAPKTRRTP